MAIGPIIPVLLVPACSDDKADTGLIDYSDTVDSNDSAIQGDTSSVGCEDSAFDQIQDAVDFASDGDTVEVCDGTYDDFSVFDKTLTIVARDGHFPQINASGELWGILVDGNDEPDFKLILSGFEVFGASESGVSVNFESGAITLQNFDIHDNGSDNASDGIEISISGSRTPVNISISDSTLHDNNGFGLGLSHQPKTSDAYVDLHDIESYGNTASGLFAQGYSDL